MVIKSKFFKIYVRQIIIKPKCVTPIHYEVPFNGIKYKTTATCKLKCGFSMFLFGTYALMSKMDIFRFK